MESCLGGRGKEQYKRASRAEGRTGQLTAGDDKVDVLVHMHV